MVELLRIGDEVVVIRDGREALEPVKWIGSFSVNLARHAHVEEVAPIRIRANAIAEGRPGRDLLVSPEHCLILEGRCVPAKLLVNGGSIISERDHTPFTYYHVELEQHGILLAENLQAESYLDTGNRSAFDGEDSTPLLHPVVLLNPTADRWLTDACAPLARVPDEVTPIWQSLAERSDAMGLKIPTPATVTSPDVHLTVDGKRIQPTSDRNGRY
ncbi:MAG TPA: Hint domain-containing protein, partial [Rhodopila sp.]|nr:Hint domain-containing protein [Rhodopila sp.]